MLILLFAIALICAFPQFILHFKWYFLLLNTAFLSPRLWFQFVQRFQISDNFIAWHSRLHFWSVCRLIFPQAFISCYCLVGFCFFLLQCCKESNLSIFLLSFVCEISIPENLEGTGWLGRMSLASEPPLSQCSHKVHKYASLLSEILVALMLNFLTPAFN